MRHWQTCSMLALFAGLGATAGGAEWISDWVWQEPPIVSTSTEGGPPSDAIVLLGSEGLGAWEGGEQWAFSDGVATAQQGGIQTKAAFGDCQLHVEWATPEVVEGHGQGRGNSGIHLMGRYEIQVLDSFQNPTYFDGQAAALYKTRPPLVNASRGPGVWQTYDIIFTAPRFDERGLLLVPAYVTVLHNGVLVQNHTEVLGTTAWHMPPSYQSHGPREPIRLQFHGNPIRYRNIWIRELNPQVASIQSTPTEATPTETVTTESAPAEPLTQETPAAEATPVETPAVEASPVVTPPEPVAP